jgi:multiple sugar transport system ATP-binding protein
VLPQPLAARGALAREPVFGIRPENIALQPGASAEPVDARVVLTEPLGAETLVTLEIGGQELVARCSTSFARAPGSSLPVYMDPAHVHLFDGSTGMALH